MRGFTRNHSASSTTGALDTGRCVFKYNDIFRLIAKSFACGQVTFRVRLTIGDLYFKKGWASLSLSSFLILTISPQTKTSGASMEHCSNLLRAIYSLPPVLIPHLPTGIFCSNAEIPGSTLIPSVSSARRRSKSAACSAVALCGVHLA